MNVKSHFAFFRRTVSKLTGRSARRIYIAIILILVFLTTAARLRSYLMARRIQAVLHGLAEIRIDQTTEEQLLKAVPYLVRNENEWKVDGIVRRWYYAEISNESDRLMPRLMFYAPEWMGLAAYWLGYRYMRFDARVLVQDGRVTNVRYGLVLRWGWPRAAIYIVSASSVHGQWLPYQSQFEVTSQDDESPQYRAVGDDRGLSVTFTNDAPPERTRRAFQLHLSCFWSLRGCSDPPTDFNCAESIYGCGGARTIAPGIWQDAESIKDATLERLRAGKCPDSIIEARMRYLPDVTVLRLEVTGSRHVEVNEEGYKVDDWFTDYKLQEVIRGQSTGSWKNVRFQQTIPSPVDPWQTIANQNWPQTKIGSQVLFFGNMRFQSCRFIPVSPPALEMARKIPVPPKRPEDQILTLQ